MLNHHGLQDLVPLILAVAFFAACVLDRDTRLRVMVSVTPKAASLASPTSNITHLPTASDPLSRVNLASQPNSRKNHPTDRLISLEPTLRPEKQVFLAYVRASSSCWTVKSMV